MKPIKSPFLIVGSIVLIISVIGSIQYLVIEPDGGMALAGVLFLISLFATAIILFFEQLLLKFSNFSKKSIWVTESLLLLLLLSVFLFNDRQVVYQVDESVEYFVVIENPAISKSIGRYSFPFNKRFKIPSNNILFVNPKELEPFHSMDIKGARSWKGHRGIGRTIEVDSMKYSLFIYFPYGSDVQETEIQQILENIKTKI